VPNDLTGDFDVAAQFAIPAVNRMLAAMHAVERFPHSASVRVDDVPRTGPRFLPTAIGVVDAFGDVVSDQERIGTPNPFPVLHGASGAVLRALDPVVNIGDAGFGFEPVEPSDLQGRAQFQLFPPTIDVADASGTNVTVRMTMLVRYFPDANTSPVAEFIRGELRITAPVGQVASQVANVVEIDIKATALNVVFTPLWSSSPISAADRAAIDLVIRNAIKTSFVPSNSTLPASIRHMRFKTMGTGGKAIGVLLKLEGGPGNPATANTVFLSGSDDFALAVGADYVHAAFQPMLDEILAEPVDPVSFTLSIGIASWRITYTTVLNSATIELINDEIVLSITGHAETRSWPPSFDFTVKQRFSLAASGSTAELVVGGVSIDTSSWIIDRFRGRMESAVRRVRDVAIARSDARGTVRNMLNAESRLGGFLNSLLKPAKPRPGPQPATVQLDYTGVNIDPNGIVLHGSLGVSAWPVAHAEFEQVTPYQPSGPGGALTGLAGGPDYSALKSWIPGGTVERYEWKLHGQIQAGLVDENRFVYMTPPPGATATMYAKRLLTGFVPMCVTVHGSRLSQHGPVTLQPVAATVCGVSSFPLLDAWYPGELPLMAMVRPGPRGLVHVTGHTLARRVESGRPAPSLIVHFADSRSAGDLESLSRVLRETEGDAAPAAIVVVLGRAEIDAFPFVEGVTYSEDDEGLWEKKLGLRIERRPFTVVTGTGGRVVWQRAGELDVEAVAREVRNLPRANGPAITSTIRPAAARIGHQPADFVFEHAPGHELTLRKLAGTPVTLAFWRTRSKQSLEHVRSIDARAVKDQRAILLFINDGEEPEVARRAAAEAGLQGILVIDRHRRISQAYGVEAWPTVINVDSSGIVRSIQQGTAAAETDVTEQTSTASVS
jgi:hypothetical protein